jgi:type VI secretion system secreted protein VgrG
VQPPKNLLAPNQAAEGYNPKLEVYDFPGKYKDQDKGSNFSRIRLEAEQCYDHRRFAENDAPSLFPGSNVTVQRHPLQSELIKYLVVRCNHSYGVQKYRASSAGMVEEIYRGFCELLPSTIPFRMLPLTPKPRVLGIETAKVVCKKGDNGEEISTDEHGRVWVQFYWDREPQKTCPIRVAQIWASKQWGGQFIPRVDMEVVVQFLEGDPDRPLITGCVYNGDNKYPYTLPGNKTQSGWKSRSTKNGGDSEFNEFFFEDLKGSELVRLHCQKDHLVEVNRNQTGYVGAVDRNSPYAPGNQTWTVGGDRSWTIQQGNDTLDVKMGNLSIDVEMGNISVKADLGSITVDAMQSITLKVGESSITLDQMGVTIKGIMISVQGQAQTEVKAPMTQIEGEAMLQLSGGIIMIG